MVITELVLKNFRNYSQQHIRFAPGINYITGENGAGKSNILEAVSLLSTLKSFRGASDSDMTSWASPGYFCSALTDNGSHLFEIGCSSVSGNIQKRLKVDSKEIRRATDFFGKLQTVIFSPLDLGIINSGPDSRRRFFDMVQSKTDDSYLHLLTEFRRILSERNRLLKNIKEGRVHSNTEIDTWDDLFISNSLRIMKRRSEFVKYFQVHFSRIFESLSCEESPDVEYQQSWKGNSESVLREELHRLRKREFMTGTSALGPQRDDFCIMSKSGRLFSSWASQGQRRTAAISMRLAESAVVEIARGEPCIILVDDVFSELDGSRRKALIDHLAGDRQIILTLVDVDNVDGYLPGGSHIVVKNGTVCSVPK